MPWLKPGYTLVSMSRPAAARCRENAQKKQGARFDSHGFGPDRGSACGPGSRLQAYKRDGAFRLQVL
jgi:hypothetical protein